MYRKLLLLSFAVLNAAIIKAQSDSTKRKTTVDTVRTIHRLQEVQVKGRKVFIQSFGDKTIMSLKDNPLVAGKNTLEALQLAPGVFVDNNDNIRLRGKGGVQVMIDGKPSNLSSDALAAYLKSLPANTIDKIELIYQPSSKYDATGVAGIINIKTFKEKEEGFNGTLSSGFGYWKYPKSNAGINLNYRIKRFNLYGNYNYSNFQSANSVDTKTAFGQPANTTRFDAQTLYKRKYDNQNYKIGADYYTSAKGVLSMYLDGYRSDGHTDNTFMNTISRGNQAVDSVLNTPITSPRKSHNNSVVATYHLNLDTLGGEFNVGINHSLYHSSVTNNYESYFQIRDEILSPPIFTRSFFPTAITINTANASFSHTLHNKINLETGLKASEVKTTNEAIFDSLTNNTWYNAVTLSNNFRYKENVYAGYLTLTKKFGNFNVRAGARVENTVSNNELLTTGENTKRNYVNLFPDFLVSQTLDDSNQITFTYGRRITRPSYQDLNPFKTFNDQFSYKQGNPNLIPQYTDNYNMTYLYKKKYSFNLKYSRTNNYSAYVSSTDSLTSVTREIIENIAVVKSLALSIDVPTEFFTWWNSNISLTSTYDHYVGLGQTLLPQLKADNLNVMVYGNQSFSLPGKYFLNVNGFYISKFRSGYYLFKPQSMINAGISKALLSDNLNLSLNISDIFYGSKVNANGNFNNTNISFIAKQESRVVNFSASYRFGKQSNRRAKDQKNIQETQRIKSVN